MAGPKIVDICTLVQAGIDPKTKLPIKLLSDIDDCKLESGIKHQLRILDEQDAVRRYKWNNLPSGITSELLERIIYYRGQAIFFYVEGNDTFYFLPYALQGNLDVYGRYTGVTPIPFNASSENKNDKIKPWIPGMIKYPVYDISQEITMDTFLNGCVILKDYTEQLEQKITPRSILQEPVLNAMAEAFPLARTNLIANSGVKGMRVDSEDSQQNVEAASMSVQRAAKNGKPWIPIVGALEFQDLTSNGSALKSEEFLLYMQALDNYRLSLYGLKNGGLFQKKAHMLEAEQNVNDGNVLFAYQDGLTLRQNFCDKVNAIWGLGISCEPSEQVMGIDENGDGTLVDKKDQSGIPGEQPEQMIEGDDSDV